MQGTSAPRRGFRAGRHRKPLASERVWSLFSDIGRQKERRRQEVIDQGLRARRRRSQAARRGQALLAGSLGASTIPFSRADELVEGSNWEHHWYNSCRDKLDDHERLPKKFRFIVASPEWRAHAIDASKSEGKRAREKLSRREAQKVASAATSHMSTDSVASTQPVSPLARQIVEAASQPKHLHLLDVLIKDRGLNINGWLRPHNRTALSVAAGTGNASAIAGLVERRADVNVPDRSRYTPLHWAAACGHEDCVQELLNFGAKNISVNGETPEYLALSQCPNKVVGHRIAMTIRNWSDRPHKLRAQARLAKLLDETGVDNKKWKVCIERPWMNPDTLGLWS